MQLDGAELPSLMQADLTGASLRDVRVIDGSVISVVFRDADLTGADFTGSLMNRVDFTGATDSPEALTGGGFYAQITCPDGFVAPQSEGAPACEGHWEP